MVNLKHGTIADFLLATIIYFVTYDALLIVYKEGFCFAFDQWMRQH